MIFFELIVKSCLNHDLHINGNSSNNAIYLSISIGKNKNVITGMIPGITASS